MHTCAYCGRRLLWLHRVVDGYRYCCREHARLHRPAREEAARNRENACAAGEQPPAELLPEHPQASSPAIEPATLPAAGSSTESPLCGLADRLVRLDTPPVDSGPARSSAITPVPEDPDAAGPVVRVIVIPGREPVFPAPHAGPVPLALAPVADGRRKPLAIHPLRPRRTVLAPAHRAAAPQAGLRGSGAVVPASWLAPVGELLLRPSTEEAPTPSESSSQEPNAVLVFSFLEGGHTGAGSSEATRPVRNRRVRPSCGALAEVPAPPLDWGSADPLSRVPFLISVRSGWRPPAVLWKPRPVGVIPRLRIQPGAPAASGLLEEQTASIQPFRLHRMPMRRLQLRPVTPAAAYPPRNLPALSRMLFLKDLHVPRAASMPYRPAYRLLPPPAAFADPAQPHGDLASYAANRRQGE